MIDIILLVAGLGIIVALAFMLKKPKPVPAGAGVARGAGQEPRSAGGRTAKPLATAPPAKTESGGQLSGGAARLIALSNPMGPATHNPSMHAAQFPAAQFPVAGTAGYGASAHSPTSYIPVGLSPPAFASAGQAPPTFAPPAQGRPAPLIITQSIPVQRMDPPAPPMPRPIGTPAPQPVSQYPAAPTPVEPTSATPPTAYAPTGAPYAQLDGAPIHPTMVLSHQPIGLLEVTGGIDVGQRFGLMPGENRLGRVPGNHVVLQDPAVSGQHAILVVTPNDVVLYDDSSTNGTFVNQQQVLGPRRLQDGDLLAVGQTTLRFRSL